MITSGITVAMLSIPVLLIGIIHDQVLTKGRFHNILFERYLVTALSFFFGGILLAFVG